MTETNNVRKNGAVKVVLGAINSSINPAGVSVADLAIITGKTKKQIHQAIYNLGDRIGAIKDSRGSRYFGSQALADESEQRAREAMQRAKIARAPKMMANLAAIKSLYKSSTDTYTSVQIKELLGRSDDERFGEAIYALADLGELHRYGGHRLTRYAIVPFTTQMIAEAEKMQVEAAALRKINKSRKQRALSKGLRKGCEGGVSKKDLAMANAVSANIKKNRADTKKYARASTNCVVTGMESAKITVAPTPVDYRFAVDKSYRGEFSRQWQQLRSAA